MSVQELVAEALKLSSSEREELVRRLLAGLSDADSVDPLLGLGTDPVVCGAADASVQHDRYLYGAAD
jgi:hypothetical protein